MEKSELLKCRDKIENIRQKMNWDIKKIHEILKEKFDNVPVDYNTFFKQYKYDGVKYKGSIKYFCKYYEYIYNLKEVQEKLTAPSKTNTLQLIAAVIIGILLGLITWNVLFPDMELKKIYNNKECLKKCIKQTIQTPSK
ncbi:hypothetical protein [Nautilia sp.]